MRLLGNRIFTGGLRPRAPGIYRFPARMAGFGGGQSRPPFRLLSRRSGCVPAEPYPPLRYFQSGKHQPRRAILFHRTAPTPLTRCLTPGVHFNNGPSSPFLSAPTPSSQVRRNCLTRSRYSASAPMKGRCRTAPPLRAIWGIIRLQRHELQALVFCETVIPLLEAAAVFVVRLWRLDARLGFGTALVLVVSYRHASSLAGWSAVLSLLGDAEPSRFYQDQATEGNGAGAYPCCGPRGHS